jgi:hypothetical protein
MSILGEVGTFMGQKMRELRESLEAKIDTKISSQTNQDIEITDPTKGIILQSPLGKKYRVTINDEGEFVKEEVIEILPPSSTSNTYSMVFNGSDTVFDLGTSLEGTGSKSVSFWLKRDSTSQSNDGGILTLVPSGSTSDYISIALWEDTIQSSVTNSDNTKGSTTLSLDTWYHIVVIKDGTPSTTAIYVNGEEETLSTNGTWVGNIDTPQAKIGEISYSGVNYNFTGLIDEVAIFDSALEASTIETIYSGSLPLGTSQSLDLNTLQTPPSSWYRMGD